MAWAEEIRKEEFVQNYLQYRWLDETRSKLIDRVFIIVAALLFARLQFNPALSEAPEWLFALHGAFVVATWGFGYSIVRYRRQQRGHGTYLKACRKELFNKFTEFGEYKAYVEGRRVYLTEGIETVVVIMATLAPCTLMLDHEILQSAIPLGWLSLVVVSGLPVILVMIAIKIIVVPFAKYNYKDTLDWNDD